MRGRKGFTNWSLSLPLKVLSTSIPLFFSWVLAFQTTFLHFSVAFLTSSSTTLRRGTHMDKKIFCEPSNRAMDYYYFFSGISLVNKTIVKVRRQNSIYYCSENLGESYFSSMPESRPCMKSLLTFNSKHSIKLELGLVSVFPSALFSSCISAHKIKCFKFSVSSFVLMLFWNMILVFVLVFFSLKFLYFFPFSLIL